VTGCTRRGPQVITRSAGNGRLLALTFDDGPKRFTAPILRELNRLRARATFFEEGRHVGGHRPVMREIIDSGDEIGNHSTRHHAYPGRADLAHTDRLIHRATGFEPCLFRPPGGAFNSGVVGDARSLGMATVIWDVDPRDWSTPGTGAIYSRVVGTTNPGSIILMHDGGGNRSETVGALPHIIRTLRGRGYSFVTVTKLLHGHMIWGPAR
jgi:peptidoglycan/xylan/chitin deacetylase (PgdA/CDA1 family)